MRLNSHLMAFFLFLLVGINANAGGGTNACKAEKYGKNTRNCMQQIYLNLPSQQETAYCNVSFSPGLPNEDHNHTSHGKDILHWEHVVPQSWLKQGDDVAKSDTINLLPTIATANLKRSNYPYGIAPESEETLLGFCDFKVTKVNGSWLAEPEKSLRGDFARIHFYMKIAYGWNLPNKKTLENNYLKLLESWDIEDPLSKAECKRIRAASSAQHELHRREALNIIKDIWAICFDKFD